MAKPKRLSCLFICFRPPSDVSDQNPSQMVESEGARKKTRRFSCSRFRMKKTSAAKTVPVETSITPKTTDQIEETQTESKKLSGEIKIRTTNTTGKSRKPVPRAEAGQRTAEKPRKIKHVSADKEIILESSTPAGQSKADTCQIPICRKLDSRSAVVAPAAEAKRKQPLGGGVPTMTYSNSFPPQYREMARQGSQVSKIQTKKDPIVGLSIVVVILVILLTWGRVCAILCTCAWFYLIPCFTTDTSSQILSHSKKLKLNLDTEEYKKKIILEGLLQRNNRRSNSFGLL